MISPLSLENLIINKYLKKKKKKTKIDLNFSDMIFSKHIKTDMNFNQI